MKGSFLQLQTLGTDHFQKAILIMHFTETADPFSVNLNTGS